MLKECYLKYPSMFPTQEDGGSTGSSQSVLPLDLSQPPPALGHPDAVCFDVRAYQYIHILQ